MKTDETNTVKTMAKFVGCVIEKCQVGGSLSLRGIYEIPDPDGKTALYERHTSQMRGMGWNPTDAKPECGRVYGAIWANGFYSARNPHVFAYDGPETVEITWESLAEVAYRNVAIALAGRAHMPKWQRDHEPANPLWEEAANEARARAPHGWTLDWDTGHGASTPCPNLTVEITAKETELDSAFRAELEQAVRDRISMRIGYRPVANKAELVAATVAFNCGIVPDYNIPEGWEPSDEAWNQAVQLMDETRRNNEMVKSVRERFDTLCQRIKAEGEKLGFSDYKWDASEFFFSAKSPNGEKVHGVVGYPNGPHYHTTWEFADLWLRDNMNWDASGMFQYMLRNALRTATAKATVA